VAPASSLNLNRRDNDASFALDLLRVFAAELVCVFHAIAFFKVDWLRNPHLPPMQNFGVCVFFVLSGFLIAHTLMKKSEDPGYGFPDYLIDRVARIYSGWVPALIFVAVVDFFLVKADVYSVGRDRSFHAFLGNLLMFQQYTGVGSYHLSVPVFGSGGPFWSLSIEFHIYLLVGAAFFMLRGAKAWLLLPVALVYGQLPAANLTGTSLFVLWLAGFAMAHILANCAANVSALVWLIVGALSTGWLCIRLFPNHDPFDPALYPWLAISFAAFIALAMRTRVTVGANMLWLTRTIRLMADYSFSLYLIHYTILFAATKFMTLGRFRTALLMVVVANLCAIAIAVPTEMQHGRLARWLKARFRAVDVSGLAEPLTRFFRGSAWKQSMSNMSGSGQIDPELERPAANLE
jgi:peptidoglycan/LPS O-acetylase OafA/YrhL